MDAYLHILWKCQLAYPNVYNQRINILDSQFYSWLYIQWERIMPSGVVGKPLKGWSVLKYKWSAKDLMVHWILASVDLKVEKIYLLDPYKQKVTWHTRNDQVTCLRLFLTSMLHQFEFYDKRRRDDTTYDLVDRTFQMSIMSISRVPQWTTGGNCDANTLRLTEHLLAEKDTLDWSEDNMSNIRENMVMRHEFMHSTTFVVITMYLLWG
ncbi:hypothetical protein Ddye_005698 [Dipteronia dyeriana]|uniref:Ubiquitin-like protease family profile domain-containing protein n=1 Tax=Dipteronia dyeriana TaxID=168575 RepID=A0AAD9XGY8_9ROSI|nr:hypothetical protein Ddye_005698 [Dipteronia dyeriana]